MTMRFDSTEALRNGRATTRDGRHAVGLTAHLLPPNLVLVIRGAVDGVDYEWAFTGTVLGGHTDGLDLLLPGIDGNLVIVYEDDQKKPEHEWIVDKLEGTK